MIEQTPDLTDLIQKQKMICKRYGAGFFNSPFNFKVGISLNAKEYSHLNGLRHPMQGDTTGWYIWDGEYSSDPDFFKPLHVEHLVKYCPQVLKFLGLSPGWRFLIAEGYEDVWQDMSLLNIDGK